MTDLDQTPRYAPENTLLLDHGRVPITGYRSYPPGTHPDNCPIGPDWTALELQTKFRSSWWGFKKCWINSELRMICQGFPARCELRSKWEVCNEV